MTTTRTPRILATLAAVGVAGRARRLRRRHRRHGGHHHDILCCGLGGGCELPHSCATQSPADPSESVIPKPCPSFLRAY